MQRSKPHRSLAVAFTLCGSLMAAFPVHSQSEADCAARADRASRDSAGASAGKRDATTVGGYQKGMATFTVAKGGLMYEASIAGGGFTYEPL